MKKNKNKYKGGGGLKDLKAEKLGTTKTNIIPHKK